MTDSRQERAKRYLLGQMPEQEALEFEAQYFADDELFEEMAALENEMVDSFARNEFTVGEKQSFQKGYLTSPGRQANVEFARTLAGDFSGIPSSFQPDSKELWSFRIQSRYTRIALASVALAASIAIAWLSIANLRLRHQVEQLNAQQARWQQRERELVAQIAGPSPRPDGTPVAGNVQGPGSEIVSLLLAPGMARVSGEIKTLMVAPATRQARLELVVEEDYPVWRGSLENSEGAQLWQRSNLTPKSQGGAKVIIFQFPAHVLKNGQYLIKLSGITPGNQPEAVADYHFAVDRR